MIHFLQNIKGTRKYIYYAILLFLFYEFMARNFGLNRNFCFILEFFSIILLFRHPYQIKATRLEIPFKIMVSLFIVTIIGALLNFIPPLNYIFGFRGQFLTIVFLFACASYLTIADYEKLFNLFYKFQYINFFCTIYQFTVLGLTEDFNNGAFTTGLSQDIFCGALMTYYFYTYNQKKVKLYKLLFVIVSSLFIAVIQDERFIFLEICIIGVYFSLSAKLNLRKIILSIGMLSAIILGISNLSEDQSKTINSINGIMEYSQQTGGGYDLPRIGSSSVIQDLFFHNQIQELFGIGLGKGIETNLPFLDNSFYLHANLSYNWFSFQNVFLHTGWIGTILYIGFFISLMFYNLRCKKRAPKQYKYLYDISNIFTILCISLIWYNAALRLHYGIFPYFILGLGPCVTKQILSKKIDIQ